ncbi:MAG: 3'-5' exonuclease, partial [bacterium]
GLYAAEQSFINEVYEKIGNNLENAKKCVESFGRDWEYPIWSKEKKEKFGKLSQNYIGSRKSFITQACNLISDFMLIRTFDGTNRGGKWEKIKIEKEYSEIPVYSLKVEPTEDGKRLYIADGIVVSNSIYRFRGADGDAFNQLKTNLQNISHDKDVEQQITSNFRSRQSIIDLANDEGKTSDHVSNLIKGRPFKETPGKIGKGVATKYEMKYDDAFQTLSDEMKDMGEVKQTAFLARTNEPLIHASLKLMKQGTPFIILGKDIANDLIKHIDKMTGLFKLGGEASVDELEYSISHYQEEMNDKHSGKSAMAGALKELKEISEAMISSLGQFKEESPDGSVFEFKKWLKSKFGGIDLEDSRSRSEFKKKVENQNPVILTTVHKSKGLQFQRVFILRDDLWPHPRSTREEDLEQEKNNRYIAMTRGEDEIHILDLEDQPGYKSKNKE